MLGVWLNPLAVIVGGLIGSRLGSGVPERFSVSINRALALCVLGYQALAGRFDFLPEIPFLSGDKQDQIGCQDRQNGHKTQFLPDNGQNEVRVRLRQVQLLLHRIPEAYAPQPAVADRGKSHVHLVEGALVKETRHAVRVGQHLVDHDGTAGKRKRQHVQDARA